MRGFGLDLEPPAVEPENHVGREEGDAHPGTLLSMNHLAKLYRTQGRKRQRIRISGGERRRKVAPRRQRDPLSTRLA